MTRRRRTQKSLAKSLALPRTQREVIRDVMLSAGQCATWLTLDELAKLTHFPPASISAQLRHLRKRMRGAFEVVKRCRAVNPAMRGKGSECCGSTRCGRLREEAQLDRGSDGVCAQSPQARPHGKCRSGPVPAGWLRA